MTDELDKAGQPEAESKKPPEPRRPGGKQKRGPNKWLLRIFRGYDANKRRIYYSEIFHGGSRDADKRLTELHNRHKAGLPLKFSAKTFKDFFDKWIDDIDDGERRECTVERYRQVGRTILIPAFGKMALADITDAAITRLYKTMRTRKPPYSQATIRMAHVVLSALLNAAEAEDLLLRNPMHKIRAGKKAPKQPKPDPVAMTAEESQRFLDAASSTAYGFMFNLAFFLGARPCEWLGLKWADVDWEGKRITNQRSLKWRHGADWYTTNPKTAKSIRTIALTETLTKGLHEHRRRQLEARLKAGASWEDHDFIFANEAGEPFRFESMRRLYKGILAAAKLPGKFMLKTSRHSCASALINEPDVPLKAISARLGHASIRTTADIYGVVDDERGRQVSERIGQLFGIGKK
jgi:integrase